MNELKLRALEEKEKAEAELQVCVWEFVECIIWGVECDSLRK
jgi:hypothetical protein